MHIVVVLRLVVDTVEELAIDPDGTALDAEWVSLKLNEFDDQALEEAVLLKEANSGTVTAVGLAAEGMDRVLQTALARGADRAVRIEGGMPEMLDSRSLAAIVAAAVDMLAPDLVLSGVQTPQDLNGQLVPLLAEQCRWPHASGITRVTFSDGLVRARQEYGEGRSALLEIATPAALGIQAASKPPRYVSGTRLRQAITGSTIESLAVTAEPGDAPVVLALTERARGQGASMLEGGAEDVAAQIVDILRERNLLGAAA